MKASELKRLWSGAEAIRDKLDEFLEELGARFDTVPTSILTAGTTVEFNSRGRILEGQIGQVSEDGEKLFIYVPNEDGFGATGHKVPRASVIEPEVESGLTDEDVQYMVKLLKVKMEA